jgi:hypothetical protein
MLITMLIYRNEGMTGLIKIEERENYLFCVIAHSTYTPENSLAHTQAILTACQDSDKRLVFVNNTANHEEQPATLKALAGLLMEDLLLNFQQDFNISPRIAVLGAGPRISTYKPTQSVLERAGIQFAAFTDEEVAREWLFRLVQQDLSSP